MIHVAEVMKSLSMSPLLESGGSWPICSCVDITMGYPLLTFNQNFVFINDFKENKIKITDRI